VDLHREWRKVQEFDKTSPFEGRSDIGVEIGKTQRKKEVLEDLNKALQALKTGSEEISAANQSEIINKPIGE
jgi:hypothetical protein